MGALDRLGSVLKGVVDSAQAPVGLVWDLGRAPFLDDDLDGVLGTLNATTTSRLGQLFGGVFGPETGLGAAVGGLPESGVAGFPRRGGGALIGGAFGALEKAGQEAIRQPLSTMLTAGSLADSPTWREEQGLEGPGGDLLGLFDPDTWSKAYDIAENRSPGQSFALMFGTKDILDEEEVGRLAGTDGYNTSSGLIDALTRLFLDPDVLALKGGSAARLARTGPRTGAPLGRVTQRAPVQLGRRAERGREQVTRGRILRDRVQRINNTIDRTYHRLPSGLQDLFSQERDFLPSDISRLERLERTRLELASTNLEQRVRQSSDPAALKVLGNIEESRRAREARVTAGAVPETPAGLVTEQRAARTVRGRLSTALRADIDAYFGSPPAKGQAADTVLGTETWTRINNFIDTLPADADTRTGLIHDRLFPTHHRGDVISRSLAEAPGPAEREHVMRIFLGDQRAIDTLAESDYALAMRLQDLQMEQTLIRSEPIFAPVPDAPEGQLSLLSPTQLPDNYIDHILNEQRARNVGQEIDAVIAESTRNQRLLAATKSLPAGPTLTHGIQLRHNLKSSSFYQTSLFGKGVRMVTDRRPHNIVDASDPNASAQLSRMMREAGYDDNAIAAARGQFDKLTPNLRGAELERRVEAAERKVLTDYGLDPSETETIASQARLGKAKASSLLRTAEHKYDAQGRARLQLPDSTEMVELPLYVTQLQNAVVVPHFARLRRQAERYARLKHGENWRSRITQGAVPAWTTKQYGVQALQGLMDVWRPAVLLRPAWTMRVIGDEQLRMIAKFGALAVALDARQGIHNYAAEIKKNPAVRRILRTDSIKSATRRGSVLGAASGLAAGGPLGAMVGGAVGNRLVRRMAEAEQAGYTNLRFGGQEISGPFGLPGSKAEFYRTHVSQRTHVDEIFGREEALIGSSLRRERHRWRTYVWGESESLNRAYRASWASDLRHQVAQDPMGRQLLAGKTVEDVLDWLDNTLEGRSYAAKVPWRSDHISWVESAADQVAAYTANLGVVGQRILNLSDKATAKQTQAILDLIPEAERAPIHGAALTQTLGDRSPITQAVNGFVNHSFEVLGGMATDELSRNPTFARYYTAEVKRLLATEKPGRIHESKLTSMEDQARAYALRETRDLLYDMAERSRFGDMVRLLMPFYSAWEEVLTRWAGLTIENPVAMSRARQIWNAPDKANWTYEDDQGNTFLRVRIPSFAAPLVNQGLFHSALDSQGYIYLDKRGFNLAAEGTPGFGPIVQWATSEVVKEVPELEQSVRFIIPFGPTEGFVQNFIPPTARRTLDIQNTESKAFSNAEARILTTKLTQMQTGDIPMVDMSDPVARKDFLNQVRKETKQFMSMRLFAGYVAPVAPLWESPYKPYVDIYRAMRDGDFERAANIGDEYGIVEGDVIRSAKPDKIDFTTADDAFLDVFGEEFFALTQSFTESLDGIPPTLEGLETSERYGNLITAHPEWGGVIAGYDGGGEAAKFSRAVYDRQADAGSRRRLPPDEIAQGPDIRLGWAKYSKYMDQIEAMRVAAGLPNLAVKGAASLRQTKEIIIAHLASQHPAWFNEFSTTDRNAWERRIEGARALTENPTLRKRPDIKGLADYLRARETFKSILASREHSTLSAAANQDVAIAWVTAVTGIVESNPEFADLYYRKLENDSLEAE